MPATPGWVALSLVEHLGGKKMRALLDHFDGDLNAILRADEASLRKVRGIGAKIASSIGRINVLETTNLIDQWREQGVQLMAWDDPEYPTRLRGIDDAPPTLFMRGDYCFDENHKFVALVGTRRPTGESVESAKTLAFELAARGNIVVSGLAHGVDSNAHLGALAHPDGITLAVLGGGVLNVYPPQNHALADAIINRGALLGEVEPSAEAKPQHLVARNRLISGLCDALIVVETSVEGGAMYAARRAFEQGRRVYALDFSASGNIALMGEGAIPLTRRLDGWIA
jgi:DNA processing protein